MGGGGCPSRCRDGWASPMGSVSVVGGGEGGGRERAVFSEKVTGLWAASLLVVDGGRRHCFPVGSSAWPGEGGWQRSWGSSVRGERGSEKVGNEISIHA